MLRAVLLGFGCFAVAHAGGRPAVPAPAVASGKVPIGSSSGSCRVTLTIDESVAKLDVNGALNGYTIELDKKETARPAGARAWRGRSRARLPGRGGYQLPSDPTASRSFVPRAALLTRSQRCGAAASRARRRRCRRALDPVPEDGLGLARAVHVHYALSRLPPHPPSGGPHRRRRQGGQDRGRRPADRAAHALARHRHGHVLRDTCARAERARIARSGPAHARARAAAHARPSTRDVRRARAQPTASRCR